LKHYDYIITGAGCAGLSLLVHLLQQGGFAEKQILLIDKAAKNSNDRTWCFWEKGAGVFEDIVFQSWDKLWFYGENISSREDISPYRYKMIRGIDYYDHCFSLINEAANIEYRKGNVEAMESSEAETYILLDREKIHGTYIFNSIPPAIPALQKRQYHLLQHFKGWIIETPEPRFNLDEATLMDFRVSQEHGTTFVYVLPLSTTRALVEYTLFTPSLLTPETYDKALRDYLQQYLQIGQYTVREEEFGVIPMTNYRFPRHQHHIIHIGTAGGQTKPSSGYTFRYIQKNAAAIVRALQETGTPFVHTPFLQKRFHWYDSTLLNVLANGKMGGKEIFSRLFRNNDARRVLQFLDNETSLAQELRIMQSLPKLLFTRAGLQQWLG
jgi:lycopene beta-cyclase